MRSAFYGFLGLPVGGRFTIIVGVALIIYLAFGGLIYRLLSFIPFILKRLCYAIYLLIELPISALHKAMGGLFSAIDQGIATGFSKLCSGLDKCYNILHKPKSIHRGGAFLIFLLCGAYFIIPDLAGIDSGIFNFWKASYLKQEAKSVAFIESTSWLGKEVPVFEVVDPEELPVESALPFDEIKYGDKGERVSELQKKLNEIGYNVGRVDGDFGRRTENAVKQFQEDMNLEISGVCDEATWEMLF